jgi:hypothetical protein
LIILIYKYKSIEKFELCVYISKQINAIKEIK